MEKEKDKSTFSFDLEQLYYKLVENLCSIMEMLVYENHDNNNIIKLDKELTEGLLKIKNENLK